jgi:hypothetical protein
MWATITAAAVDPGLAALLKGPPLLTGHLQPASPPPAGPQVGFAGIGKPWKVERALQAAGCELADFAPFPDHTAYDAKTLKRLAIWFAAAALMILALLVIEGLAVVQGGNSTISELIWMAWANQPGPCAAVVVLLAAAVFFLLGHFWWQSSDKYDQLRGDHVGATDDWAKDAKPLPPLKPTDKR